MLHGPAENFIYDQARPAAIYVAGEGGGGRGEVERIFALETASQLHVDIKYPDILRLPIKWVLYLHVYLQLLLTSNSFTERTLLAKCTMDLFI